MSNSAQYHALKAAGMCVDCRGRAADRGVRCARCAGELTARRARWGTDGCHSPPATLLEIGRAMGLSRERVRQIQAAALNRFCARMGALGYSHDDALLGLAALGVQSQERGTSTREVVRGRWYR